MSLKIQRVPSERDDETEDNVVETDPTGRYVRFTYILGVGAFKTVFRAMDTHLGIEVAWNQILLDTKNFQLDKAKVLKEIEFFQKIRHQNVIEFYHFWIDEFKNQVVFITELMPSGTLKKFIVKSPEVKLKVIKTWCKQILQGLHYLHTQDPPIIHRDIKTENIFINGTTEGEVKIGDLGLATFCIDKISALSVTGTPNYMAPELYNEIYSTSVDIWAFGMVLLELMTQERPYFECDNVAQIYRKVSDGLLPRQLNWISDQQVKEFIQLCLSDEKDRPTAEQLLAHSFFSEENSSATNNLPVTTLCKKPAEPLESCNTTPNTVQIQSPDLKNDTPSVAVDNISNQSTATTAPNSPSRMSPERQTVRNIPVSRTVTEPEVIVVGAESSSINMKLRLNETTEIQFTYNFNTDTASSVASEMVRELGLQNDSYEEIKRLIQDQVTKIASSTSFTALPIEPEVQSNSSDEGTDMRSILRLSDSTRASTDPDLEELLSNASDDDSYQLNESDTSTEDINEYLDDDSSEKPDTRSFNEMTKYLELSGTSLEEPITLEMLAQEDNADYETLLSDDFLSDGSEEESEGSLFYDDNETDSSESESPDSDIFKLQERHNREYQKLLDKQRMEIENFLKGISNRAHLKILEQINNKSLEMGYKKVC